MSKPFDYSKWDKIELSDDEEDVHPNIDKESWFRLKHRTRVEREEKEEIDKKRIRSEIDSADLRMREIQKLLSNAATSANDDSDDEDLEDTEGLMAELEELKAANKARFDKLDEYERNKKWNVDNMCHVVEEKTIISKSAATPKFNTETGYALPSEDEINELKAKELAAKKEANAKSTQNVQHKMEQVDLGATEKPQSSKPAAVSAPASSAKPATKPTPPAIIPSVNNAPGPNIVSDSLAISMMTYGSFVEKYEDILEGFMAIGPLDKSKDYLLQHGDVLLQENASSYLLLACLEDEMNDLHDKMRLVARQSQIVTNIAELAKTLKQHPGNVIVPFFKRMDEREHLESFIEGVNIFIEKVKARAIVKKKEIDDQRLKEQKEYEEVALADLPKEERLGPGGLDPVEVFETLPQSMQEAFESRDTEKLKQALLAMTPEEAENHMNRCVAAGLWNEG